MVSGEFSLWELLWRFCPAGLKRKIIEAALKQQHIAALKQQPISEPVVLLSAASEPEQNPQQQRAESAVESEEEVIVRSSGVPEKCITPRSLAVWRHFRMTAWVPNWQRQYDEAQAALEKAKAGLSELGSAVEAAQRRYDVCLRQVRLLEMRKPKPEAEEGYNKEFEQLCALPDVLMVMVGKRRIQVWTEAIHVSIHGVLYTLGQYRFEIRFAPTGPFHSVFCVESGRTDGIKQHPHGPAAEGGFCFGSRNGQISALLTQGEYLPVIILMLEGIRHVNEDISKSVVVNYRQVHNTSEQLNGLQPPTTAL